MGQSTKRSITGTFLLLALTTSLSACGSAGASDVGYVQVDGTDAGDALDAASDAATEVPSEPDPADAGDFSDVPVLPRLGPPYPIVLAHGFFGFDDFAGASFINYFYKVKENLEKNGEALVYTPAVDPFNSSEKRGAQLAAHVQKILEETGYEKVNIIGHSQGGLDARVVAHDHPEWVASVWTFATPHYGTPISDVVLKLTPSDSLQGLLDAIVKIFGRPIWQQMDDGTSLSTALHQFSKPGISAFNAKYTDAPGVAYYSLTGRSQRVLALAECQSKDAPPFVTRYKYIGDPVDPLFSLFASYLSSTELGGAPNDGLVRVKDAKWGTFLGCIPADHVDEIGHLFGGSPGLGNSWKYQEFYVELVRLIRDKGY